MEEIATELKEAMPSTFKRREVYRILVKAFNGHDWDTHGDVVGIDPALDVVLRENGDIE